MVSCQATENDVAITTEHNGRELQLDENTEEWHCNPMRMKAKTLKALKAKLDKFDGQARKVNVPVVRLGYDGFKTGHVVMIAKSQDWERDHSFDANRNRVEHRHPSVWVQEMQGNEPRRVKAKLSDLFEAGPETDVMLEAVKRREAMIRTMKAEIADLIAGAPRLTIEQLTARSVTEDE
jgi:hypothetical protein